MLVVDLNALQAVNVLNLVDHVIGQSLDTHNVQDVMRCRITVHDVFALLDEITFLNRNVFPLRHHVLDLFQILICRLDRDTTLVLIVPTKAHITIDFRDDRVIFWTTCLEQLGHTRQTTCNVLGLGTLTRDTRKNVTGPTFLSVFHGENGVHRHGVRFRVAIVQTDRLAIFAHNDDLWFQIIALRRGTPVGYDLLGDTCGFVQLVANRKANGKVNVFHHTVFLGDDWKRVWIPFHQLVATGNLLTVFDQQFGTIAELVDRTLLTVLVHNRDLHGTTHDDLVLVGILKDVGVAKLRLTLMGCLKEGLGTTLRNTTNVECTHGQLSTGLTDGLGSNNADSLTCVHLGTTGQVTTIAGRTDTIIRFTCER